MSDPRAGFSNARALPTQFESNSLLPGRTAAGTSSPSVTPARLQRQKSRKPSSPSLPLGAAPSHAYSGSLTTGSGTFPHLAYDASQETLGPFSSSSGPVAASNSARRPVNSRYSSLDSPTFDKHEFMQGSANSSQAGLVGAGGAYTAATSSQARGAGKRVVDKEEETLSSYDSSTQPPPSRLRRTCLWLFLALIIILAIVLGVVFGLRAKNSSQTNVILSPDSAGSPDATDPSGSSSSLATATSSSASIAPTNTAAAHESKNAATGGKGSTVYLADGTSFIYANTFGGTWNAIPFNDTARAQADVPSLNEPWDYNANRINGVNLGGWLVLEPFITPGLFELYNPGVGGHVPGETPTVIDEWSLSVALAKDGKLESVIEGHYATFITEKDFADIASAGLNWVRLPIPYWALETTVGEPWLPSATVWKYVLLAFTWARKYGIRINLDFHTCPGSQNGYNHSSRQGTIGWLNGVMGWANYQRYTNYIRTLTEFVSQPEYSNVVGIISILNEPSVPVVGKDTIRSYYLETYKNLRAITGLHKGPYIAFADSQGADAWAGFLTGADRIIIDSHPYLIFNNPRAEALPGVASDICTGFAPAFRGAKSSFGIYIAGEWSLAVNDCGKWVNNVGNGQRFDGTYFDLTSDPANPATAPAFAAVGECGIWNDYDKYTPEMKAGFLQVAKANMDAFGDYFFWTWKTGFSPQLGKIANPQWNYQLALANGLMPANPRSAVGTCNTLVPGSVDLTPLNFQPGSGVVSADQVDLYGTWPPAAIGDPAHTVKQLPHYTPTGTIATLASGPTPTVFPVGYGSLFGSVNVGTGWTDAADTAGWQVPRAGCPYLDPWAGVGADVPPVCPA